MKPIKLKLFGINVLEFGSLPDGNPPQKQTRFLSPRYEPSNIATDADVLRITEAMRLAESGDTQELFRFYRDVLLSDDHIAGNFPRASWPCFRSHWPSCRKTKIIRTMCCSPGQCSAPKTIVKIGMRA